MLGEVVDPVLSIGQEGKAVETRGCAFQLSIELWVDGAGLGLLVGRGEGSHGGKENYGEVGQHDDGGGEVCDVESCDVLRSGLMKKGLLG